MDLTSSKTDGGNRLAYRLDLEYDGTDFAGWQFQPDARTVQGTLELALAELFGEEITIIGAGRTDAGVHATGQVAHFRSMSDRHPDVVVKALNALLPSDVRIRGANYAAVGFHARFSAYWRGYTYRIALRPLAIDRQYAWQSPFPLNISAMQEAAQFIVGEHSFRAFSHKSEKESHYLSTVFRAQWQYHDPYLEFLIEANRFLHGMVRLLVGTFVDVGRGKRVPADILRILDERDVRNAGPKAPGRGLILTKVGYSPWDERESCIRGFSETV